MSIFLRVLVLSISLRYGLDPAYSACIVEHESSWRADAVGRAGEIGLTQIMPSTGEWFAEMAGIEWCEDSLYDPEYNLELFAWAVTNGYAEHWSTHSLCKP